MSRYRVILLFDTVNIRFSEARGGIRGGQRRSPFAVSTGLVIYVSVFPADLARRSLLLATVYQKMIAPYCFGSSLFVVDL